MQQGPDLRSLVDDAIGKIGRDLLGVNPEKLATRNVKTESVSVRFLMSCRVGYKTEEWKHAGDTGEGHRCPSLQDLAHETTLLIEQCEQGNNEYVIERVAQYIGGTPVESDVPQVVHEQVLSCVETCETCSGRKVAICPGVGCRNGQIQCSCRDGTVACDACRGSGKQEQTWTCPECHGARRLGQSKVQDGHYVMFTANCSRCHGRGSITRRSTCNWCYGQGRRQCQECGGAGQYVCRLCSGIGTVDCSACVHDGRPTGFLTRVVRIVVSVQHDDTPKIQHIGEDCPDWIKQYLIDAPHDDDLQRESVRAVSWNKQSAQVAPQGKFRYAGSMPGEITGIEATVDASGSAHLCRMFQAPDGEVIPFRMDNILDPTVAELTQAAMESTDSTPLRALLNCKLGNWAIQDQLRAGAPGGMRRSAIAGTPPLPRSGVVSREKFNDVVQLVKKKAEQYRNKARRISLKRILGNLGAWFLALLGGALVMNYFFPAEIAPVDLGISRMLRDAVAFLTQGIGLPSQGADFFTAVFFDRTEEAILWCALAAFGSFVLLYSSVRCFDLITGPEQFRAWALFGIGALISGPVFLHEFGINALVFMLIAMLAAYAWRDRWRLWFQVPIWGVLVAAYAVLVGPEFLRIEIDSILASPISLLEGIAVEVAVNAGKLIAHAAAFFLLVLLFARKTPWSPDRFWKWLLCYGTGWYLVSAQFGLVQEAQSIPGNSPRGVWVPFVIFDLMVLAGWLAILRVRRRRYTMVHREMEYSVSAPFARLLSVSPGRRIFSLPFRQKNEAARAEYF